MMKANAMRNTLRALCAAALLAVPAFAADDPLYAEMGGKAGLDRLVDASVDIYLADPRIKMHFAETNLERLSEQFKIQFCQVAGGPCEYKGHSMAEAHKGLKLTNYDFAAVVEDLQMAMDKMGIPFAVQGRFLARLAPMKPDVVTR
jgi:hemoglobin